MDSSCFPRSPALAEANVIPIAELSPTAQEQGPRYFRGTVVLLWPYSSSTKQFRVLLSEPDFRLRSSHGQVRITFQGGSAEAVAKSQIGIGDTVLLSLDGVKWHKKDDEAETRTGELDWRLIYGNRVMLELTDYDVDELDKIYRGSHYFGAVNVDSTEDEEDNKEKGVSDDAAGAATPLASKTTTSRHLESPSLSQSAALSFRLDDESIFGYTEEEDGYIFGKGRKRTKWGRPSSEWVFVDSPPSPIKESRDQNTYDLDFDTGEEKDVEMQEQPDVRVTSPTPSHPPIDENRGVSGVQDPEIRPSVEDTQSIQGQVPHTREQEEEQTTAEQVNVQGPLEPREATGFADAEAETVDQPSEPVLAEDMVKGPMFELGDKNLQPHAASSIQHESELASSSTKVDEHHVQASLSEPSTATASIFQFEPDSTGLLEPSEEASAQHLEGSPHMQLIPSQPFLHQASVPTRDTSSVDSLRSWGIVDAAAAFANVFDNIPGQPFDQEAPHVEPGNEPQVLDIYDRTPQPNDESEQQTQNEWTQGLEQGNTEEETTHFSERDLDEEVEAAPEVSTSELGESTQSQSDVEVCDERSVSSIDEEEHIQQPVQLPGQPDIIVIDSDSDDEPQVDISGRDGISNDVLPLESMSPPKHDDADMASEHSNNSEGCPHSLGLEGTDVTFDHRMSDNFSQDDHEQGHVSQVNPGAAKYRGLDGCVEYEPISNHPTFPSAMESGRTQEHKTRLSPSPTLSHAMPSTSTEMASEPPRFRSWSIPVRTIPLQSQQPKWGKTLHTGTQMMRPAGTQETALSQSQELSPSSPTARNLLTPQFSQRSRSVTSNTDASESEMLFDGDRKEPSDNESTPRARQDTTPEQRVGPLASGALIEGTDSFTSFQAPNDKAKSFETIQPSLEEPRKETNIEDTERRDQHKSHEVSWPIAGLRTRLAYFCPFSLLRENLNSAVDTVSIVASATPVLRGTRKPRDYFTTLHLLDPSTAGSTVCAQLFRRNKDALPVTSKGDVILLRNFKVRANDDNNKPMLCTMGHSSWAVFIQGNEEEVQINGPPVTYTDDERACVTELRQWYVEEGAELIEKNESLQASREGSETANTPSSQRNEKSAFRKYRRARNSTGRGLTVHYLRHGRRYTDLSSAEHIHKLRDGKMYAHF